MSSKKIAYIAEYNRTNYKMYQFRVKNENKPMIEHLNSIENKSGYLNDLIEKDMKSNKVLSLKEIKQKILPVCKKWEIKNIYLFGSYSRGEATNDSDIDIFCDKGLVLNLYDQTELIEDFEKATGKKIDVVFTTSDMSDYFRKNIEEDMIKLC